MGRKRQGGASTRVMMSSASQSRPRVSLAPTRRAPSLPVGALSGPASKLNSRSTERILRGPLWFEVGRFGLPLALGMGLQTTFNLVDAYLFSRLPASIASSSLGAIGICDQLAALGTIVSYGLSVATAAMLSRRLGAGDLAGLKRIAWQSTLVVLALAGALGCLGVFGARWLIEDVVGAKGQVASLSIKYLRVTLPGSFSIFLLLHLTAIQRALGSSKTPVAILLSANALNLLLAVLLVYGPGPAPAVFDWGPPIAELLGIARLELLGGAWATVLARSVMLLPLVVIIMRRFDLFGPGGRGGLDPALLAGLWRIGWPSGAQLVVRLVAMLAVHSLVARAYTTADDQSATTALGVVFRLETMALFVGLGWGSAAQTFVGQNLGAANPDRAQKSGYCAATLNGVSMGLLALGYHVYGRQIVTFFDSDPRFPDCLESMTEILHQTPIQQSPNPRRQFHRQLIPVRLPLKNRRKGVGHRFAREGQPSGKRLVQEATERPDVGPSIDTFPASLLGAHVRGRPEEHTRVRHDLCDRRRLDDVA